MNNQNYAETGAMVYLCLRRLCVSLCGFFSLGYFNYFNVTEIVFEIEIRVFVNRLVLC